MLLAEAETLIVMRCKDLVDSFLVFDEPVLFRRHAVAMGITKKNKVQLSLEITFSTGKRVPVICRRCDVASGSI